VKDYLTVWDFKVEWGTVGWGFGRLYPKYHGTYSGWYFSGDAARHLGIVFRG